MIRSTARRTRSGLPEEDIGWPWRGLARWYVSRSCVEVAGVEERRPSGIKTTL
jgi:hypothetical protein